MLRPESPLPDHRSLLPRRFLAHKAQITPSDKRRNRRSLELSTPTPHTEPKLLPSRTTDSLSDCRKTLFTKQESADSLKRVLIPKQDSNDSLKKGILTKTAESLTNSIDKCSQKEAPSKKTESNGKSAGKPDNDYLKVSGDSLKKSLLNKVEVTLNGTEEKKSSLRVSEILRREFFAEKPDSRAGGDVKKTELEKACSGGLEWRGREECARRGLLAPVAESGREEGLRPVKSWYGYGTLPSDTDKTGGSPASGRRALEQVLAGGLRSLTRPVRRAASRDSVCASTTPQDKEGLRKCSTVLALTDRSDRSEPIRAFNRLRAPSVCSRCSSLLSLAGGSRYSLDGSGFVPAPTLPEVPVLCKLCLEDTPPEELTIIAGCECSFCTKCMRAYVEFEVTNGAYEISCPDAGCKLGMALNLDELSLLLSPTLMQKHLKFRLNHEVAMDAGRAFCPRVGCDTVVSVQAASAAHCPTCRHDFCSQCNQEWHGSLSCEAAAAASAGPSGAGAPLLVDGDLIKWCPTCRVPIEKDEGCAQMMCKRCKHVFCWYCLASLDDDFLLRHYDKGPCKNKLGHSRASVIWHRAQVVGIFAGFGLLLLVASPLLLLAAPCIVCCKCRLCNPNSAKNLDEGLEEGDSLGRDDDLAAMDDITPARDVGD